MNITNLIIGEKYELKNSVHHKIVLNVGAGGDCLVYGGPHGGQLIYLFRCVVTRQSVKRDWRKTGSIEVIGNLAEYQIYSKLDLGTGEMYKYTIDSIDRPIKIDLEEYESLEPFAAYSTIHVLKRVEKCLENYAYHKNSI